MSKYAPLTAALNRQKNTQWQVSFSDIESIIGARLPDSAYRYRAWWSNNPTNSVMTKAWLKAGWVSSDVDMAGRTLTFRKSAQTPPPSPSSVNEPPAQALTPGVQVALSPSGINGLHMIADAAGETVEEAATRLLQQGIAMALPAVRAERARKAIESRSDLPEIDLAEILEQSRDMH